MNENLELSTAGPEETLKNANENESNFSISAIVEKSGESAETAEIEKIVEKTMKDEHPLKTEIAELIRKFMPSEAVEEIAKWKLINEHNAPVELASTEAKKMVIDLIESMDIDDLEWSDRYQVIFNKEYPRYCREFWVNNYFAHRKYRRDKQNPLARTTFESEQFDSFKPAKGLAMRMAPMLTEVVEGKGKEKGSEKKKVAKSSAELLRFMNGEKLALPNSAIYEVSATDRPRYKDKSGWDFEQDRLPRKIIPARVLCPTYHPKVLEDLIADLRTTFAWPEDNDGTLGNYLGYLIQPLICYLKTGQMPGYTFKGPPKCGKGYLASVLVAIIYCRTGDPTVFQKMLSSNSYEMEVSLNDMRHALYMVYDEIVHATDEQLVVLNSLLTQQTIQVRKFGVGYQKIENQMTIALTSVDRTFSDETEARLATIKLIATRPMEIDQFHEKWKSKGAEILAALIDKVNVVDLDISSETKVADRRPGFTLVSHFVEKCFHIKPNYELQNTSNEILDDLCEMYFSKNDIGEEATTSETEISRIQGRKIGKRRRYSIKNFADFISSRDNRAYKRREAVALLTTALSYKSTRFHPLHKENGYLCRWENVDRYCHIEIAEEGKNGKRREWIYIEDITPLPKKGGVVVSENNFQKNLNLLNEELEQSTNKNKEN